jgi:hypothetical protein
LYRLSGDILNGEVKLKYDHTPRISLEPVLTLPPSKFGLLLVEFMPICPPNEVLNRLTFEVRMASEHPPQS